MIGQQCRPAGADVANVQGIEEPGQPAVLARLDAGQQVLRRFAAHPLQAHRLLQREPVQIAVASHQAPIDQLVDQLVSQPFDIHRIPGGEIADRFLDLRRALEVRAADIYSPFVFHQSRAAGRAFCGESEDGQVVLAEVLFHPDNMGDDFARLFHDDHVAHAYVLALDLLRVVQAGPAHGRVGNLYRLQLDHGRDRSGFAHLHADGLHLGGRLVLLEFVGDHPAGRLRRGAEPHALIESVDLQHQPVDLEIQLMEPPDELLAVLDGVFEGIETFDHGSRRDAAALDLGEELHVRLRLEPLDLADAMAEETQPPPGTDAGIQEADTPGHHVPRIGEGGVPFFSWASFKATRSELVM